MDFKTHPDRKNRPRCCIPTISQKHTNSVNMHCNSRKTILSVPASSLQNHTRTRIIHHHKWSSNIPWEWSPRRHVMGCDKPTVASYKITPQVGISNWIRPTSQGRQYQRKGGLNGWIRWWHHHNDHLQPVVGVAHKKISLIGHPHHIKTAAFRKNLWNEMTPSHSANLREKVIFTNTRIVWVGKSIPALYRYSYQDKNRQPVYKTS